MRAAAESHLARQTFTTSCELEYFTERELITQTGYGRREWFPRTTVKELVDNGLDAVENAGISPTIQISLDDDTLTISDNGSGIPATVVERTLDYSSRTSDKAMYVSPTRGAQGNALKTVLAIPYVLRSGQAPPVEIEARNLRHTIAVSLDQIERRPQIALTRNEIVKTSGTAIRVPNCDPWLQSSGQEELFLLNRLICDYHLFNPHASFSLNMFGDEYSFPATDTEWIKWLPSSPTSPHWYTVERLENLILSYLANERREQTQRRTVREFCSEFSGLTGSAKTRQVISRVGLERAYLEDLIGPDRKLDRAVLSALLIGMQEESRPIKPEALGVLGESHFRSSLANDGDEDTFRYKRISGTYRGLPFLVEAAFLKTEHPLLLENHIGINWAVPLSDPLPYMKERMAENCWVEENDPICLALHLACPSFNFTDRGKGRLSLPYVIDDAVNKAVTAVTAQWTEYKKKKERNSRAAERAFEEMSRKPHKVTIKSAAYDVMERSYLHASGRSGMANARQIMYAARPLILEATGNTSLDDKAFTQKLVPTFVREFPELTKNWDVIYDARGHLTEPHTGHEFGIGTLEVRGYLREARSGADAGGLSIPELSSAFPTHGPKNRYAAILYVEKEGFMPLLQAAGFAERYDMALCSSKGMGTTSLRDLVGELHAQHVTILCLHDFDKSGFSIVGTLLRDTERYRHRGEPPRVIDLWLALI